MLGRYRVPVPRHVFVRERSTKDNGGSKSPFAKTVAKHLHEHDTQTLIQIALGEYFKKNSLSENDGNFFILLKALNEIADFESETWKNPHLKAWSEYQARDNYQKANLRRTLREMLESCGHHITEVLANAAPSNFRAEKEEVLRDRARKIANSPDIDIERALEIQRDLQSSSDDRFATQKAFLRERLPGIALTPDFIYWCEYKNRHVLSQLENYFMFGNPGAQEQRDRQRWAKVLSDSFTPWDIRTKSLELEVLRSLKIEKFLDGKERVADDPEIKQFHQQALAQHKRIKTALGITVKESSDPIYLLKRCLEKMAVSYKGKQYREGSERFRKYRAVLPDADANCAAVLAAYSTRFKDLCQQPASALLLSQTDQINEITLNEQSVTKPVQDLYQQPAAAHVLSQTDQINEITLNEQSVTEPEMLSAISFKDTVTEADGLLEDDQPTTAPFKKGALVRWASKTAQFTVTWCGNGIAAIRDTATGIAFNARTDELEALSG